MIQKNIKVHSYYLQNFSYHQSIEPQFECLYYLMTLFILNDLYILP